MARSTVRRCGAGFAATILGVGAATFALPSAANALPADCNDQVNTWAAFQSAFNASNNNVVCLTGDISISGDAAQITAGTERTLDLNGFTLNIDAQGSGAPALGVPEGAKLTIRDSNDDGAPGPGTLIAQGSDDMYPLNGGVGIGTDGTSQKSGEIIINSGTVNARGGYPHAGIGSEVGGDGVTINGGNVTATGNHNAPGIGANQPIVITAGTVVATGGENPPYGGGYPGLASNVTISGGHVTSTGGRFAAGIGGVLIQGFEQVSISGGTVVAQGGLGGAGIGTGAYLAPMGPICITGGSVTATGGEGGAGIGSGSLVAGAITHTPFPPGAGNQSSCVNDGLTVTGGSVDAQGGARGAGIGGGFEQPGIQSYFSGGVIDATGGAGAAGIGAGVDGGDPGTVDVYATGTAVTNGVGTGSAGAAPVTVTPVAGYFFTQTGSDESAGGQAAMAHYEFYREAGPTATTSVPTSGATSGPPGPTGPSQEQSLADTGDEGMWIPMLGIAALLGALFVGATVMRRRFAQET